MHVFIARISYSRNYIQQKPSLSLETSLEAYDICYNSLNDAYITRRWFGRECH